MDPRSNRPHPLRGENNQLTSFLHVFHKVLLFVFPKSALQQGTTPHLSTQFQNPPHCTIPCASPNVEHQKKACVSYMTTTFQRKALAPEKQAKCWGASYTMYESVNFSRDGKNDNFKISDPQGPSGLPPSAPVSDPVPAQQAWEERMWNDLHSCLCLACPCGAHTCCGESGSLHTGCVTPCVVVQVFGCFSNGLCSRKM